MRILGIIVMFICAIIFSCVLHKLGIGMRDTEWWILAVAGAVSSVGFSMVFKS